MPRKKTKSTVAQEDASRVRELVRSGRALEGNDPDSNFVRQYAEELRQKLDHRSLRRKPADLLAQLAFCKSIYSPIRRLPPEILSIVFEYAVEDSPNSWSNALTLGYVCSHWRAISLSAPRIWTSIYFPVNQWKRSRKYGKFHFRIMTQLERSQHCPFSLEVDFLRSFVDRDEEMGAEESGALALIEQHRVRCQHLKIRLSWEGSFGFGSRKFTQIYELIQHKFPDFSTLEIVLGDCDTLKRLLALRKPHLHTLRITDDNLHASPRFFTRNPALLGQLTHIDVRATSTAAVTILKSCLALEAARFIVPPAVESSYMRAVFPDLYPDAQKVLDDSLTREMDEIIDCSTLLDGADEEESVGDLFGNEVEVMANRDLPCRHASLRSLVIEVVDTKYCWQNAPFWGMCRILNALTCTSLSRLSLKSDGRRQQHLYDKALTNEGDARVSLRPAIMEFLARSEATKALESLELQSIPLTGHHLLAAFQVMPELKHLVLTETPLMSDFDSLLHPGNMDQMHVPELGSTVKQPDAILPRLQHLEFTFDDHPTSGSLEAMLESRSGGVLRSAVLNIRGEAKNVDVPLLERLQDAGLVIRSLSTTNTSRETNAATNSSIGLEDDSRSLVRVRFAEGVAKVASDSDEGASQILRLIRSGRPVNTQGDDSDSDFVRRYTDRLRQKLSHLTSLRKRVECALAACDSLFSPIRKLPPEILSVIFEHVVEGSPNPWSSALFVGSVCSYWRNRSLCTPQMWSFIPFILNQTTRSRKLAHDSLPARVRIQLERSQHCLFFLEFHFPKLYFGEMDMYPQELEAFNAIQEHSIRCHHLKLHLSWLNNFEYGPGKRVCEWIERGLPNLSTLDITLGNCDQESFERIFAFPKPQLRTLRIMDKILHVAPTFFTCNPTLFGQLTHIDAMVTSTAAVHILQSCSALETARFIIPPAVESSYMRAFFPDHYPTLESVKVDIRTREMDKTIGCSRLLEHEDDFGEDPFGGELEVTVNQNLPHRHTSLRSLTIEVVRAEYCWAGTPFWGMCRILNSLTCTALFSLSLRSDGQSGQRLYDGTLTSEADPRASLRPAITEFLARSDASNSVERLELHSIPLIGQHLLAVLKETPHLKDLVFTEPYRMTDAVSILHAGFMEQMSLVNKQTDLILPRLRHFELTFDDRMTGGSLEAMLESRRRGALISALLNIRGKLEYLDIRLLKRLQEAGLAVRVVATEGHVRREVLSY
ncbi:hypothetical protein VNI00_007718 [Paramarasmius palmivorus]|uniref:F-box domain-containing protein n=1 Tax=Paramarasmius palmivorus TaxID=297713 RepID=A0AAW0D1Z1_9AGAR